MNLVLMATMMTVSPLFGLFTSSYQTWGIAEIGISIVAIGAICALVYIALAKFNVQIPDWVQQVFWVIVVAFVIIFGIRLIAGM